MPSLRIGINALYLIPGGVGGTEIYLRSLLGALSEIDRDNHYVIFTNRETGSDIAPRQSNFKVEAMNVRATFRPGRIVVEQTALPLAARRLNLNVMLNPGFTAPVVSSCPNVTVFHDLQHKRHPEFFRWFDLPFWRALLHAAAHRSTRLIAVSHATRDDLLHFYSVPASKVHVIPHGVDPVFFEIGNRVPEPIVLCVSTLHPHKNLERLVRVFSQFHETYPEYKLVIAGLRGFHADVLDKLIDTLRLRETVRLTGWIPRDELYGLFRKASAFVYPSLFEGFGMPVLEALAAGIPTACSSAGPLPDVGGDAAIYFDPMSDEAMLQALTSVTCDQTLRTQLASKGPARSAQFSWKKTASDTLAVLREAVAQRK